jgi:hypothetical protein
MESQAKMGSFRKRNTTEECQAVYGSSVPSLFLTFSFKSVKTSLASVEDSSEEEALIWSGANLWDSVCKELET